MDSKKIVLLCGDKESSRLVFHALDEQFVLERVIVEDSVPRSAFLQRRVRKLGLVTVFGQILFSTLVVKPMRCFSRNRIKQILDENDMDLNPIPADRLSRVPSVNSDHAMSLLEELEPDIIVVCGTRIIGSDVLALFPGKFINIHTGITPEYRGVHGAYWALVNDDRGRCGVTIHEVDAGIDTGTILAQVSVLPERKDNFTTYPFLQLAVGIRALNYIIRSRLTNGTIEQPTPRTYGRSRLWSHPTLWGYLINRVTKKVK